MQFPVPQFTDVEDKIIGPLTVKQFGIIFGVGVIVFLGYSTTKSLFVAIVLFVLFGLPALGLALVPFNGRPMYSYIGKLIKFITSPKQLIFHKEVHSLKSTGKLKDAQLAQTSQETNKPVQDPQAELKKIQEMLNKTASAEKEVAGKIER